MTSRRPIALLAGLLMLAAVACGSKERRYEPVLKQKTQSQVRNPAFNPNNPASHEPEFLVVEDYRYGAFDTRTGRIEGGDK